MKIAVLAVQGAFIEHEKTLAKLGVDTFEIRQKRDLNGSFDGLILPGGESTTMAKLLHETDLFEPLNKVIQGGLPTFGTCAGVILLAKGLTKGALPYRGFQAMDITVQRNGYGRQLGSFYTEATFANKAAVPMTFIRAPFITEVGADVKVLAEVDGRIVAAEQKNLLATTFHPELNEDTTIHQYFISKL